MQCCARLIMLIDLQECSSFANSGLPSYKAAHELDL